MTREERKALGYSALTFIVGLAALIAWFAILAALEMKR
jgi:hypothetical protein